MADLASVRVRRPREVRGDAASPRGHRPDDDRPVQVPLLRTGRGHDGLERKPRLQRKRKNDILNKHWLLSNVNTKQNSLHLCNIIVKERKMKIRSRFWKRQKKDQKSIFSICFSCDSSSSLCVRSKEGNLVCLFSIKIKAKAKKSSWDCFTNVSQKSRNKWFLSQIDQNKIFLNLLPFPPVKHKVT